MSQCPFCGEKGRLGVATKWLRTESGRARRGAYCRCKSCKARGPLASTDEEFDMRNGYPGGDEAESLIELAVMKWNGVHLSKEIGELPLFAANGGVK